MGEVIVGVFCIFFLMFIIQIIVLGANILLALFIAVILCVAVIVISNVVGKLDDSIGENSFFVLFITLIAVIVSIIWVCSKIYAIK